MVFRFTLTATIPAPPQAVYDAWLDSRAHGAMTGAEATASAKLGAAFTAWDGYITGRNLVLEPGRRIVQSWRTTRFAKADPDSEIELLLAPAKTGTKLTLRHRNVPDGHTGYRDGGWQDFYFAPMKAYFSGRG
ncbi:MAG: SRPBCC domain-containing protein [Stellaceae bacterium]